MASAEQLVDVVGALAATRTLDEVADIACHAARRLADADGATFALRDADHCRYVDEDAISPLWKGERFPLSTCVAGWAMLHREAAVIEDTDTDDRVPHDAYRPTFVRSLVVVPVGAAEPVGAIGAYWAAPRRPGETEVHVLRVLADSTAVAMDNARRHADLDARAAAGAAAKAAADEDLRGFTTALAHDIRAPLTTIRGYSELLATRYATELSDGAREATAAIDRAAGGLTRLVSDLLAYATAGTRRVDARTVPMDALVGEVVERLRHQIDERGARVGWGGLDELHGDPVLLSEALQHLVANAVTYTPADRAPVVQVELRDDRDHWELSVADNGTGIPPDEREAVFEAFRRGSTRAGHVGTGLGLALCRKIAEQHGGDVRVRDAPGGAEVVLRLPKSLAD